jgi:phenylalanyl-tRNA synthetase beta chain
VRAEVPEPVRVVVRTKRLNTILGSDLDDDSIARYLTPIGFTVVAVRPGELEVTVPTFRPDVLREIDVIEEVARHHGYDNLPRRMRRAPQVGGISDRQRARRLMRNAFAHTGALESWTPSLIGPGDHERIGLDPSGIRLSNPINPEESVLRRSLMPGLLRAVAFNMNRRQNVLRLFEVGNVFPLPDEERIDSAMAHKDPEITVVDEREMAGLVLAGRSDDASSAVASWRAISEAMGIERVEIVQPGIGPGVLSAVTGEPPLRAGISGGKRFWGSGLHPTRSATLVIASGPGSGIEVGELGEVDTDVLSAFGVDANRTRIGWLMVDFGLLLELAPRRSDQLEAVSRFPSTDIDLAFVVPDEVSSEKVEDTLVRAGGPLLEKTWLFDVFRGGDLSGSERSLAYRLRFCAPDRTLTDDEVSELRSGCISAVETEHGARLRS